LNGAVKVHVKERVLIVPDACRGVGHLVARKPNAIDSRIGFDLIYRGARNCPSLDGRLHSDGGADW
jgi:hypothetical protein